MLEANDWAMLRVVLAEMLGLALSENNKELKREIRDEVHSLIAASEARLTARLEKKIEFTREEIIVGVNDLLNTAILPQIDNHDQRLERIEHLLKAV